VQPEPQPTPASPPESLPAQAPVIAIPPPQNIVGLILTKARLMIQLRKQKKLVKIMGLFLTKSKITNDVVEKLLHVSDATATRYLSELEKQGKIKQTGKTGHAVTYAKI
jgi:Fic family protein